MNLLTSPWWKFSEYETRNGYLQPRADATLIEFDPWSAWRKSTDIGGGSRLRKLAISPLAEISYELGYSVPMVRERRPPIQSRAIDAILRWVTDFGLLGILLHQADMVRLAPRWRAREWRLPSGSDQEDSVYTPLRQTQASVKVFLRDGSNWREEIQVINCAHPPRPEYRKALEGQLVPDGLLKDADRGGSVRMENRGRPRWEQLSTTWARFFPSVSQADREGFDYPLPLSDQFWRLYAEPIDEFLEAASGLANITDLLADSKSELRDGLSEPAPHGSARTVAIDHFSIEMRSTKPRLLLNDEGRLSMGWSTPSLLASLALFTAFEMTEGQSDLGVCPRCRSPFVTSDPRSKYCSKRCRYAMQKRNQRGGEWTDV